MSFYQELSTTEFFSRINTEHRARQWLWRAKFCGSRTFECPRCTHRRYWGSKTRPEVRTCRLCRQQVRLRAGTILEHTKISLLTWLRAIFLVTQDKRGVSSVQLKRQLGMRSKDTAWKLLHRIRQAMAERDDRYSLKGILELDGADFGEQKDKGSKHVLVAVESKELTFRRGKRRRKAGFAKVVLARESSLHAQAFVDRYVTRGSEIHTDANPSYQRLEGVSVDSRKMDGDPKRLDAWLPWVFHWVENAKAWLRATYHGVSERYFKLYLAEYTYRFNRRHDQNGMFHRALTACILAAPARASALFGP